MSEMKYPRNAGTKCYAMIVDINGFAKMVKKDEFGGVADYTRDVLDGVIQRVERNHGEVVAFMGDALLSLFGVADDVFFACHDIARNIDDQCEYISGEQQGHPELWPFARGGPSIKILIEFGHVDVTVIESDFLGKQALLIGECINYASRIGAAGVGNRCLLGPAAAEQLAGYTIEGPWDVPGKGKEGKYKYYELPLGDEWREGDPDEMEETYWG